MILTIDVTVTGPDGVATGSTAVTVNVPPAQAPSPAPALVTAPDLASLRLQQRAQALGWKANR